jgi:hypothetical protein
MSISHILQPNDYALYASGFFTGSSTSAITSFSESAVLTAALSGDVAGGTTLTFKLIKLNDFVTLFFEKITGTHGSAGTITAAAGTIPTAFAPSAQCHVPLCVISDAAINVGNVQIDTNGALTFSTSSGNFGTASTNGVARGGVSFTI